MFVEVMRNAAREHSQPLQLLRLNELMLVPPPALGDVFNAEEDARGHALDAGHAAAADHHGAAADVFKVMRDLEVVEGFFLRDDLFEQLAQFGNVPLAVAEAIDQPAFSPPGRNFESLVEGLVGRVHPHVVVEDDEWSGRGAKRGFGVIALCSGRQFGALERVDIHQHEHDAVDLFVERQVGSGAQDIPAPVLVAHLALMRRRGVDHFGEQALKAGHFEIVPDAAECPSHVGRQQIKNFPGQRCEATDGEVAPEQQDGRLDGHLEVIQVGIEAVQFRVPIGHFFINRGQLFVGGFELFLGGLQLFISCSGVPRWQIGLLRWKPGGSR